MEKEDIPNCTFDEVYKYIDEIIGKIDFKADVLILTGGDHLYWYNNAKFDLIENNLYKSDKQKYMITREMSNERIKKVNSDIIRFVKEFNM